MLSSVDATFLTTVLPTVPILPQHAVEASYAAFLAGTKDLRAKDLTKLADTIDAGDGSHPAGLHHPRRRGRGAARQDRRTTSTGRTTDRPTGRSTPAGTWQPRAATSARPRRPSGRPASTRWRRPTRSSRSTGSRSARGRTASSPRTPSGSTSRPGRATTAGLAATRYLDFVPAKADGSDLVAGTVDIFQYANPSAAFKATAAAHGVRVVDDAAVRVLRPRLQRPAGPPLRRPRPPPGAPAVHRPAARRRRRDRSARGSRSTAPCCPAAGPTTPTSRSRPATRPPPARSSRPPAGSSASDGVYAKGGVRLAAQIVVRADTPDRIKMADLIALQARDCGMDLDSLPTDFWDDIVADAQQLPPRHPGHEDALRPLHRRLLRRDRPGRRVVPVHSRPRVTDAKHPGPNASTSAASATRSSTASTRPGRRPTTRPSGPASTGRRRRRSRRRCRPSSCGPTRATTSCARRSRPSTDPST